MERLWRQGDVLPPEAVESLGYDSSKERLLIISHSCDLQRMTGPRLAIVSGQLGDHAQGKRGAKSIRWLQLSTHSSQFVDYDIDTFCFVDASVLSSYAPWETEHHRDQALVIGRWIGQKYDRLALPDSVVEALDDSGVSETLEKALKRSSDGILDVRIYLDEKVNPPVLTFLVIHDATGQAEAADVCASVERRATARPRDLDGRVVVAGASPISEDVLKYAQWRKTQPWRVEYLSLRETPPAEPPTR